MILVGLGHEARVGKDTAGRLLVQQHGFIRLAFADLLKDVAYDINPLIEPSVRLRELVDKWGWDEAKQFPETRRFLQELGTVARERLDENIWVTPVLDSLFEDGRYVITDVRFPNEFNAIAERGGVLIKLTRAGSGAGEHVSETALRDFPWPHVISNDGSLVDLERSLVSILGL